MMINMNIIKDVGFFDESYFMYVEDVDFCYRTSKKGWEMMVDLDIFVWHKEGASSFSDFASYWASKNRLRFIFKNLKGIEKYLAFLLHMVSKLFLYLRVRDVRIVKSDIKGFLDFFKEL